MLNLGTTFKCLLVNEAFEIADCRIILFKLLSVFDSRPIVDSKVAKVANKMAPHERQLNFKIIIRWHISRQVQKAHGLGRNGKVWKQILI